MGVTTRVQTFGRELDLMIDETLSPEAFSREFGKAARSIIEGQDAANDAVLGYDAQYKTFVDGKASTALEMAQTRIVAEWELLEPMFAAVRTLLREKAPLLKGDYRDSIELYADGLPVVIGPDIPAASEYYFAASVPYARKIERGQSRQAPDGVFEAIAAVAGKRFGNIARVRFGYRSLRGGAVGEWASKSGLKAKSPGLNRAGSKRTDWLTRQPAIVFTVR